MLPDDIEWNFNGKLQAVTYHDAVDNTDYEDTLITDARFNLDNDIFIKSIDTFIKIGVEWQYEIFNGANHQSNSDVFLKEVYAELRKDKYTFGFGRQIVTWGKLDDYVILDRINPQDFRHFILYDKQERKDPALMLQCRYFKNNDTSLEMVYMPFFEPSRVKIFGSDWALFGHLLEAVNHGTYTSSQKNAVNNIAINDDDSVTDKSLKNGQFGLRLRGKIQDADYALYYMNIYNSIPSLRESTPNGTIVKKFLYSPTSDNLSLLTSSGLSSNDYRIEKVHPRINIIGADYETVLGEYGLRGEIALFLGLPFMRDDFSYVEKDMLSFGIGIDHTTSGNVYFDIQFVQDYIFNYGSLFAQEESPCSLTGTLSKEFLRGKLELGMDWAFNISYSDWMINPQVSYELTSGVNLSVGGFVFQDGDSTTMFGKFNENDILYFKIDFSF